MFTTFITHLRTAGLPISVTEYLTLLGAMKANVAEYSVEDFYYLSRATLVKDERHLDRFDRVFGETFRGMERAEATLPQEIPEEWLRLVSEKLLTKEEMAEIEAHGGFEKLMETLRQRLEEQKERHQGGNKWIGTGGTSPFGAHGYNPEGIRIGQSESRHRRAVKVWDKREFRDLDGDIDPLALLRHPRHIADAAARAADPLARHPVADQPVFDQLRAQPREIGHRLGAIGVEKFDQDYRRVLVFTRPGGDRRDHRDRVLIELGGPFGEEHRMGGIAAADARDDGRMDHPRVAPARWLAAMLQPQGMDARLGFAGQDFDGNLLGERVGQEIVEKDLAADQPASSVQFGQCDIRHDIPRCGHDIVATIFQAGDPALRHASVARTRGPGRGIVFPAAAIYSFATSGNAAIETDMNATHAA